MATETPTEPNSIETPWYDAALALLVGIAVLGAMVFLVAVIRPPGLSPPPAVAIPLFVFNTTAAVMGFVLLRRSGTLGYAAAIVTGGLVVVTIALLATGTVGELPSGGNPIGPLTYAVLGVALVVTTGVAWRNRMATGASTASNSAVE